MTPILIIEGVTGGGKTSVIKELRRLIDVSVSFIEEETTLGLIMDQIRDPEWMKNPEFDALASVMETLEDDLSRNPQRRYLVERFHLTAYALTGYWEKLQEFDMRMHELGARMVLLTYPDRLVERRSILRIERNNWAEGMIQYYGSKEKAISAVVDSQRSRWDGLSRTSIPFLHIDTREQDWLLYASLIKTFWSEGQDVRNTPDVLRSEVKVKSHKNSSETLEK